MGIAETKGWELLREEQQISESVSVDAASRHCAERGVTSLLRLPLDVPLVQASDIDELFAVECAAPAAVIVPSCARRLRCFHRISAPAVLQSIAPKPRAPARRLWCAATPVWRWTLTIRPIFARSPATICAAPKLVHGLSAPAGWRDCTITSG